MKKKIMAALLACTLAIGMVEYPAGAGMVLAADGLLETEDGWLYELGDYGVTIMGYKGEQKDLVIPDYIEGMEVRSISGDAFLRKSWLTSVVIPDTVTSIEDGIGSYPLYGAFGGCTGLTSIDIPNSVTSIGNYAFSGCAGLTDIDMSDSVTSIGDHAFSGCASLTGIDIPDSVTSIGNHAFSGCAGLTGIDIPDSVTSIGYDAFWGCTGLTSIDIPKGISSVNCFSNCTGLMNVRIPENITSIGGSAFSGCANLKSIDIPDSVISIGGFSGCVSLKSIDIPNGVTSIGGSAFQNCTGLTGIDIPDSVTSIGGSAFYGCTGLTGIDIPDGVTSIEDYMFYECTGLTGMDIPDGVTSIGSYAFAGCVSLNGIKLPESVTRIGGYVFYNCSALKSINVPKNITNISYCSFNGCDGLTEILVDKDNPDFISVDGVLYNKEKTRLLCWPGGKASGSIVESVTEIEAEAFFGCAALKSVTLPKNVASLTVANPFGGAGSLEEILVDADNPNYMSSDGLLYSKDGTVMLCCPNGKRHANIRDGATKIGYGACWGCMNLQSMNIPVSLTYISDDVIRGCNNLNKIYYAGTKRQWNNIIIGAQGFGYSFSDAEIEYNSTYIPPDFGSPGTGNSSGTGGSSGTGNSSGAGGSSGTGSSSGTGNSSGGGKTPGSGANVSERMPSATSLSGKIKAKSKGFTVKWKKKKSVSGYQVQYSTSKKFTKKTTKTKTVKKASATSLTVKKLKAKKTYYVRVRTYVKKDGRQTVSKWSKVKSVRTKK